MDIFFQKKYQIAGQDVPVSLGFKDVIYIMEDVDSASKIVKRRDGKTGEPQLEQFPVELPQPKSIWQMLMECNDDVCRELVTELMEKSPRLKKAAIESDVLRSLALRIGSVPGLGLVGLSDENETLSRVGKEAVEMAESSCQANETVDKFMGAHAKSIKTMIEMGVDITDDFVDVLLGLDAGTDFPVNVRGKFCSPASPANDAKSSDEQQEAMMLAALAMNDDGNKGKDGAVAAGPSLWSKPKKDELNLSGLLNVLDGVVDTPGRILVMTSNHPDVLDPALIRPGRIEKKIMLGYMEAPDVVEMLEHYFQTTLEPAEVQRVYSISNEINLTPAQIEQMASESDELEEMLSSLEKQAGLRSTDLTQVTTASTSSLSA